MNTRRFTLSVLTGTACVTAFSPVAQIDFATAPPGPKSALHASLQELDDSNMRDLLFRPPEGKAVLVDAFAPWCGPCKLIEPHLDECAEKYSDQLSVVKYNVEGGNNKNLKVEMLLGGVMVRGLPTLLIYNDGIPLASHSGVMTKAELEEWLEKQITKMDELTSELGKSTPANLKKKDTEEKDKASLGVTGSKKGFVSFASQFLVDDYAVTGSRRPAGKQGWDCVDGVCRRSLATVQ